MKRFINKFVKKKITKPWALPDNTRVYCIGDIHGRDDLLKNIHDEILADASDYSGKVVVIYLGDYIDRGLHSKKVIDLLLSKPLPDFESIYLRGNHEQVLLDFLYVDANIATQWFSYGGQSTVLSYGVSMQGIPFGEKLIQLQQDLADKIPTEHMSFYNYLQYSYEVGDYFFVHAGVKPKVALKRQSELVKMWIREEFLNSNYRFEKMIVHGHSVVDEPAVLPNRIGIDTGAYVSGVLTCLVLEGEDKRFLATTSS
ncbi:metallophosphoesterase family protein [Methyloprofundus sp.]|uniref:metallophosphoesterase family protein n=1 Tax=Methyloprofundus sp. TaxID=2020875 RepID=UPI003D0A10DE